MSPTKKQWDVIEWIRLNLMKAVVGETYLSKHEIKEFDVQLDPETKTALVYIIFGRKGDEGTMASVLCRDTYHFAVRATGACQRLDSYKLYRGHPRVTYLKPRTKKEAAERRKIRLNLKENQP